MELPMAIRKMIKQQFANYYDRHLIDSRRKAEIRKFQDSRRREIYESVQLTDEQKRQVDDLYVSNYGEKIPYTWHRHFTAFTGKFDPLYFPELLFIPEFEYFMNSNRSYINAIADKNLLSLIAAGAGIHMPKTYIASVNGILRDDNFNVVQRSSLRRILSERVAFAKPSIDSCSGQGCLLLDPAVNSFDEELSALGDNYVIQERIECSESVKLLHPDSVNTFRIMTYYWNGNVEFVPIIMRIGRGSSFVDNAHAGGIFIAVDNEGRLHEKAFTEFKEEFIEHPDTHVKFNGYTIKSFHKVIDAACRIHRAIPQLGIINWDFTINHEEEPVLIEANTSSGSIWLFQMAWGCGAFGERTPQILRWMRQQKRKPFSMR